MARGSAALARAARRRPGAASAARTALTTALVTVRARVTVASRALHLAARGRAVRAGAPRGCRAAGSRRLAGGGLGTRRLGRLGRLRGGGLRPDRLLAGPRSPRLAGDSRLLALGGLFRVDPPVHNPLLPERPQVVRDPVEEHRQRQER